MFVRLSTSRIRTYFRKMEWTRELLLHIAEVERNYSCQWLGTDSLKFVKKLSETSALFIFICDVGKTRYIIQFYRQPLV